MTDMQKDIEAILGECVGEDKESRQRTVSHVPYEPDIYAYNQALADIRTRIPETARKVLERVIEDIEKYFDGLVVILDPQATKNNIIASLAGEYEPVSPQRKLSIPVSYKGQQYVTDGKDIYLWPSMERLAGEDKGDNGKEV